MTVAPWISHSSASTNPMPAMNHSPSSMAASANPSSPRAGRPSLSRQPSQASIPSPPSRAMRRIHGTAESGTWWLPSGRFGTAVSVIGRVSGWLERVKGIEPS